MGKLGEFKMTNTTDFWKGWQEALDALQTRLEAIRKDIDSHSKPHDVILDVQNEVMDLRITSLGIDTNQFL